MADAMVERRPATRFFCHRCNLEFEDVLQEYTCPFCAGGFIEQLENDGEGPSLSGDDFSDADMSNIEDLNNMDDMSTIEDSDDMPQQGSQGVVPLLHDIAFLMSGGRPRGGGRRETLMEQLVWMIGGGRQGAITVTGGAPLVLVGAPGDYVFGGEGLDAVVTQLLGQLENAGPPPLPRDQIAALPSEPISPEQTAANASCSVCWENFQIGETVSRLECDHIFHATCITPWLQLHATCPICRRSLLTEEAASALGSEPAPEGGVATAPAAAAAPTGPAPAPAPAPPPRPPSDTSTTTITTWPATFSQLVLRRLAPQRVVRLAPGAWGAAPAPAPAAAPASSSSSASGAVSSRSDTTSTNSTSSLNSTDRDRDRQYNTDIDFD